MKTIKQALLDTVAWLKANPDKHISMYLAKDSRGYPVHPLHEDAVCFCAAGRLARELDTQLNVPADNHYPINVVPPMERLTGIEYNDIWFRNEDFKPGSGETVVTPDRIFAFLEEKAASL